MATVRVVERGKHEHEPDDTVSERALPEEQESEQSSRALVRRPPSRLAGLEDKLEEWRGLADRDRRVLSDAVIERWAANLHPDDYTLADLVRAERTRQANLQTLRAGDLTDQELKMFSFLRRHEGRTCTYLEIARHLWDRPGYRVTARLLAAQHGYAAPMIGTIWNLAHHLRQKLEVDPLRPQHLATVRGCGYAWYDRPPSLDDGVDYAGRVESNAELRREVAEQLGVIEGQYVAAGLPGMRTVVIEEPDPEHPAPRTRIAYNTRPVLPPVTEDDAGSED